LLLLHLCCQAFVVARALLSLFYAACHRGVVTARVCTLARMRAVRIACASCLPELVFAIRAFFGRLPRLASREGPVTTQASVSSVMLLFSVLACILCVCGRSTWAALIVSVGIGRLAPCRHIEVEWGRFFCRPRSSRLRLSSLLELNSRLKRFFCTFCAFSEFWHIRVWSTFPSQFPCMQPLQILCAFA
jgi:hypothetical protein